MKSVAFAVVLAATAAIARAEPAAMSAAAGEHFDRGTAFYKDGDYAAAIRELEAGRQIEPHPDFLYALGQAYRKQGDCDRAVEYYREFLDTNPPKDEAARVRANIARCPAAPSTPPTTPAAKTTTAAKATTTVTQPSMEDKPTKPPTEDEPAASERDDEADAYVDEDDRSAPVAHPAPRRHFYDDVPGDLLALGGLAGIGIGATYLVLGERDAQAANKATKLASLEQLSDATRRERTIGTVSMIAGGVLGVAAIVRYVLVAPRKQEPNVSVVVGRSAVYAAWTGRF